MAELLPIAPVLPVVRGEPMEPVAGVVEEGTGVVDFELSAALLQPAKAITETKASAATVVVFNDEACMSIFL